MTKRIAAVALILALALVLMPSNAQTQAKMLISVSSSVGVTTVSLDMPDASWAEIQQAYSDLNGAPADPEQFLLDTIQITLLNQFNQNLEGANAKILTDASPPSKIEQ